MAKLKIRRRPQEPQPIYVSEMSKGDVFLMSNTSLSIETHGDILMRCANERIVSLETGATWSGHCVLMSMGILVEATLTIEGEISG